jgi:hypothetical protein
LLAFNETLQGWIFITENMEVTPEQEEPISMKVTLGGKSD